MYSYFSLPVSPLLAPDELVKFIFFFLARHVLIAIKLARMLPNAPTVKPN